MSLIRRGVPVVLVGLLMSGCAQTQEEAATAALTLGSDASAQHEQQSRRFDTRDEALLMEASVGVLQDLGFQIDEATPSAGLVVASKNRDAIEAGQVTGQIIFVAIMASLGATTVPVYDTTQVIRVSVITQRARDGGSLIVRATFQRIVRDNLNRVAHVDTLSEPTIYQAFFEKLSKAAFLEAHDI